MKEIIYLGSTLKDLKKMPNKVKGIFAHAIQIASVGGVHPDTKSLKGYGGRNVIEIKSDDKGDTYRAIYTVKFKETLYVLHIFKKKSTKGIATPKKDRELFEKRLKAATVHYKSCYKK